jgi:hypothetical protein
VDRWETRRTSRSGRDRRRPGLSAVESLEGRQLLAANVLGTTLPDLTVTGFSAPVAAWGRPLTVTVDVHNVSASSTVEPLSLLPGSVSSADAGPSQVAVYAVRNAHSFKGAVPLGLINVPAVGQNSVVQVTQTLALPNRPPGFKAVGPIDLVFVANATATVLEANPINNVSPPVPVTLEPPLSEPVAVVFNVPPVMQPGDTVVPTISVANLGPADTGPLTVAIVSSTRPDVNAGSRIVATYTIPNVPSASQARATLPAFGDTNPGPQSNVVTFTGAPVTLPAGPPVYYIGVVVDPLNQTPRMPKRVHGHVANSFELFRRVGPPIANLPPAGVVAPTPTSLPPFPIPIFNQPIGGTPAGEFPPPFPVVPSNAGGATSGNPLPTPTNVGPPGGFGGLGTDPNTTVVGNGGVIDVSLEFGDFGNFGTSTNSGSGGTGNTGGGGTGNTGGGATKD